MSGELSLTDRAVGLGIWGWGTYEGEIGRRDRQQTSKYRSGNTLEENPSLFAPSSSSPHSGKQWTNAHPSYPNGLIMPTCRERKFWQEITFYVEIQLTWQHFWIIKKKIHGNGVHHSKLIPWTFVEYLLCVRHSRPYQYMEEALPRFHPLFSCSHRSKKQLEWESVCRF